MKFGPTTLVLTAVTGLLAQDIPSISNCTRNATVVAGDICYSISAQYNVSTYQLACVNQGIINPACTNLAIGQNLCLGIIGQDCNQTYVLQPSDNCTQVANMSGIPLTTLLANNPNVNANCTNTIPGEVLCVSSTIYNYTCGPY